ncbi:Suppressor of Sensor Kinase (SLN1) [Lunasporangiospora selenospora]|uniref:Suppressor of Sensor Kinase (SLN1) n=1 Tax=Lunasporangiospora selenospora TaxID=979761 RepID=A0A9P6FZY4_9FUNG|nr:Suppressor of Sensor Kinase (SLN1) [Lunasporangiospora selenospora]
MSKHRVQEGEDEDAISAARPSSLRRAARRSSTRDALSVSWDIPDGSANHSTSGTASAPSATNTGNGATSTPRSSLKSNLAGSSTTFSINDSGVAFVVDPHALSNPAPIVEKKGLRVFFADEGEEDEEEERISEGDYADTYDDLTTRADAGGSNDAEDDDGDDIDMEQLRMNAGSPRIGFGELDQPDTTTPTGVEADPIDRYYDNHGEYDGNAEHEKDQERLDRFMQPVSNSDEGVLALNRERIDWQSMLQSVLAGEAFIIETKRLADNIHDLRTALRVPLWLEIRASLRSRTLGDEKRFVDAARLQVDGYLQEVMEFKVDPKSALSSLEQVMDVLHKVDIVESLYLSREFIDKPLYKSAKFEHRLEALCAYASLMKKMKIQFKILKNWTGSETLEVSRSKDGDKDEVSFVDRLPKENGLESTFEKSTLKALHSALGQIKQTMIENAVAFASMGLAPPMSELQQLIRFPTRLMYECLRVRLEYADRVQVPTMLNVDQMLENFKTSLLLACKIKYDYYVLESSDNGWYLESCIDSEYEKVLKSCLQFYFKLLSWKVEYWGQSKKYADSVLDLEWDSLSGLGQQIDGIGLDTAVHLCFLMSKSITFLYKHLQSQLKGQSDTAQSPGEVTRFYGKMLENVRSRARKVGQLSRNLTDTFENATEYLLDKKKGDGFANLMNKLAETGHVMIYTGTIEAQGIYMIVEPKVAENPLYIPSTLRACFEQPGTGYILIFTPRDKFTWSGQILHLDGLNEFDLDVKPGRVRLISEQGNQLDACKKRFSKAVEPYGLEIITESRANVPAVNKELNKTKKASYKLADTILQSVTVLRKVTQRVSNCQDLIQPFFCFATDYGLKSLSSMEGLPRSQFNLKLLRLSIDWVSFVVDDCEHSERLTFRWAMLALNFAMKMTKGNNILALDDSEFSWLQSKISGCLTLLVSHFDIHGARTMSETLRSERDGRSKQKPRDQSRLMEEIAQILKMATSFDQAFTEEAERNHQLQVEKLQALEKCRTDREQEIKVVGKVLDDQKPEDRSLVFLAALTDSVVIRWQMAKFIGQGTFGTVYLGTNSDTGELIAVKEIRFQNASPALVKSIHDEMKVMKMLNHPNIVRYDNIEVHRHKVYIFMEYCQGGSLADLLEHGRIEDEKVIKVYTLQLLKGLAYLHHRNVVHRDVKPDNVLLDHLGNIKFVDFGAAKVLAKNQRTRTHGRSVAGSVLVGVGANSLNGTPMYMAPEVIKNGEKGRKGSMDIWSLGCCVLEMATGRRPWAHLDNEWAVMYHVATSHPPLPDPSQMSPKGIAFLKRCFTRSSRDRPSAVELLGDDWLKGVDTDENREEYSYEIPRAEPVAEGESVYNEFEDEPLSDYPITESATSSLAYIDGWGVVPGDVDEEEKTGGTKSRAHTESAEQKGDGIEEKPQDGGDEGETADAPNQCESRSPFFIDQEALAAVSAASRAANASPDELAMLGEHRAGSKSPASCDSSMSDTVSEVGSEVEMMLSALREREEISRQASKHSSPTAGPLSDLTGAFAGVGLRGPSHEDGVKLRRDSVGLTASEVNFQELVSVVADTISNGGIHLRDVDGVKNEDDPSSALNLLHKGVEDNKGFAREMGLDLSNPASPHLDDGCGQHSPILSLSLTDKSGAEEMKRQVSETTVATNEAINTGEQLASN